MSLGERVQREKKELEQQEQAAAAGVEIIPSSIQTFTISFWLSTLS